MTPGEKEAKQEGIDEERKRHFPGTTKTGALKATWSLAMIAGFLVIVVIFNITYTNRVQRQSNQQNDAAISKSQQLWCSVLIGVLAPDAGPPQTERAWQVYVGLANLATAYGCRGVPQIPPHPKPSVSSGRPSTPILRPSSSTPSRP